jgi:CheY-like chemotaxis protein
MHILMADDDKDDFHILQEAAEKAGGQFKISYAANWMDLWRSILKALPDLIFLDLNMPVKDGFECLQLLRDETRYDTVPIIIYSTSLNKNDIDKAYRLRANYFVVKPNSIGEISMVLRKLYLLGKEVLTCIPPREEFVIV